MHPAIDTFLERPLSHKLGAWFLTLLVLFGGFWQFFYSDKIKELGKLDAKIEQIDSEIATEQRLAQRLNKARERLKDLDAKLKAALLELPDKSEIDRILEKISNLARESGLELNLFKRKDENFKEFYAEVPVNVSVTGTYHQIATFFDEVGRLSRIVNINQIVLYEPKPTEEGIVIKSDCVLTAFRYLSDAEKAERAPAEVKRRK